MRSSYEIERRSYGNKTRNEILSEFRFRTPCSVARQRAWWNVSVSFLHEFPVVIKIFMRKFASVESRKWNRCCFACSILKKFLTTTAYFL